MDLALLMQVAIEAESATHFRMVFEELRSFTLRPTSGEHAAAIAAVEAAVNTMASAIIVTTQTGRSVCFASKCSVLQYGSRIDA